MDDEILFRGKRVDNGEWVTGAFVPHWGTIETVNGITGHDESRLIHLNTVGQYTGLKDKNGQRIFNGDIVRVFSTYYQKFMDGVALVEFSYEYAGGWIAREKDEGNSIVLGIHTDIVEIIGNIHDNPELILQA